MSYEFRYIQDFQFGTLTTAASVSDTTLVSAQFAAIGTGFGASTYIPIVLLNPSAQTYEVVWLTGHSASSTSITVVRGREGSTAQAWPSGTQWVTGPTVRDALLPGVATALPTDPHIGLRLMAIDKHEVWEKTETQGWLGSIRAAAADMGRAQDGTTSHAAGRLPQMKMWTASGTTNASGILASTIPNGGYTTRLIAAVATRYGSLAAFVPTIESTSTITTINILASNTGTGAVASTAITVGVMTIGY